ncbi:stAR-related lipid transfer protein 6-like [Tubulanus polymorphus]|uniref:stAR-related lipid transfer protein 6-like n=1 Tax=Tubulanus polymorphus TaxID=672921 RepID=UPI003DA4BE37
MELNIQALTVDIPGINSFPVVENLFSLDGFPWTRHDESLLISTGCSVDYDRSEKMLSSTMDVGDNETDSDYVSQHSTLESSLTSSFVSTMTDDTDYLSMLGSVETCISEYMVQEPIVNNKIHYQTIGNQAAADLLAQVHSIRDYDLEKPNPKWSMGNWRYFYTDNEVTVFQTRKKERVCKIAGVGIIKANIDFVYDIVRDPFRRYQYDSMAKKMRVVEHVNNTTRVIHILMETTRCLLKQARDFCYVSTERIEDGGVHVVAGRSVEHANCLPSEKIPRLKAHASGFVLEPCKGNPRKTKVIYLLQVDLGDLPETIVKLVLKKQPMAISRLRNLIEKI